MESGEKDRNKVREYNTRVFFYGAFIGIFGAFLILFVYPIDTPSNKDPIGALIAPLCPWVITLPLAAFFQLVIYLFIIIINIELSGVKKWLFYAFELVVAIVPRLLLNYWYF